jgi:uncharacterized damage-inducible protein DinB
LIEDWLSRVLLRDVEGLRLQLEAYPDQQDIWKPVPGLSNSAGTLALHLAGSLQHYIGAVLGGTGYVRDRQAEFERRNLPREELVREMEAARAAVVAGFARLRERGTETELEREYPEAIGGVTLTAGQFLIHLVAHLDYHLGQVDYHRRVVTGEDSVPGIVSPRSLA